MFAPGSVNFIQRLIKDDCAVPFSIYVTTFFPAFIKMLIVQNVPFLDDVIRSSGETLAWGTKAAGGNRRHGARRRLIPDPNASVERFSQKGLRTVLTITQPLETVGYAFLLYSTADQFFIDWQSLIDFQGTCQPGASLGMVQRDTPDNNLTILTNGTGYGYQSETNRITPMDSAVGKCNGPAGSYNAYATLGVKSRVGVIGGIEIGLRLALGAFTTTVWSGPQDCRNDVATTFVVSRDFRVPLGLSFQLRWLIRGPTVPIGAISEGGRMWCQRVNII